MYDEYVVTTLLMFHWWSAGDKILWLLFTGVLYEHTSSQAWFLSYHL